MDITLSQLLSIINSPIFGMKLPTATSYKFSKLAKILSAEAQHFNEVRMALIEEHSGVLSDDNSQYKFDAENAPLFSKELEALLATTVDVGHHFPMKLEALGSSIELSPAELMQLEPLFDIEDASVVN